MCTHENHSQRWVTEVDECTGDVEGHWVDAYESCLVDINLYQYMCIKCHKVMYYSNDAQRSCQLASEREKYMKAFMEKIKDVFMAGVFVVAIVIVVIMGVLVARQPNDREGPATAYGKYWDDLVKEKHCAVAGYVNDAHVVKPYYRCDDGFRQINQKKADQ